MRVLLLERLKMIWNRSFLLIFFLTLFAAPVFASSGVQGRVAWRGELIEGIKKPAGKVIAAGVVPERFCGNVM